MCALLSHENVHRFPDSRTLAHALSRAIQLDLNEAIAGRGAASLVVSGGRTPRALFEQLSQAQLNWSKTWETLADERWVDPASAQSNERLLREVLLKGGAAAAHFTALSGASSARHPPSKGDAR